MFFVHSQCKDFYQVPCSLLEGGSETESTVDSDLGRGDTFAATATTSDPFLSFKPRIASAEHEDIHYGNDLERQLEDELKFEELMKHRQDPDKACMVRSPENGNVKSAFLNLVARAVIYSTVDRNRSMLGIIL